MREVEKHGKVGHGKGSQARAWHSFEVPIGSNMPEADVELVVDFRGGAFDGERPLTTSEDLGLRGQYQREIQVFHVGRGNIRGRGLGNVPGR